MRVDIREKWINYITVAGLVVFVILGIVYLNMDAISQIHIDFSTDSAASDIFPPWLPDLNLDWFNAMDTVSKMIFGFLMCILIGSLIGGVGMIVIRNRVSSRK